MVQQFTHGYALLIGVDENAVARLALPTVRKDVDALREVLVHPARCAYPEAHVKTLAGTAATRQGILDGLAWLRAQVQKDAEATAVLYYSGHGGRDAVKADAYYFIPHDVREGQVRERALRAADFAAAVANLRPARLLVVLDCCHAGGMGIKQAAPLTLPDAGLEASAPPSEIWPLAEAALAPGGKGLETLARGQGRAVLSSSTAQQKSWLRRDGNMSIFTYHLIAALTGHAQPQAGATEVLVSDVMSHVWRQVPGQARSEWHAAQTPDYRVDGNFPVALLLGGKGLGAGPAPDPLALPAAPVQQDAGAVQVGGDVGGSIASAPGAVAAGGNVTLVGSQVGARDYHRQSWGGISANRIDAQNVVSGVQFQGAVPENAVALLQAAAQIRTGGITAAEIKAGSVVAGVQFAGGHPPETPRALQEEVAALRTQVEAALAAGEIAKRGDAEDVQRALAATQDELTETQPDGGRVTRHLKTAAEILGAVAEAAQAAGRAGLAVFKLAPLAAMLWKLAEGLF